MKKWILGGGCLAIGFLILAIGSISFLMISILFAEDEMELNLACTGTGDYNRELILQAFESYESCRGDGEDERCSTKWPMGKLTDKQDVFLEYAEKYKLDAVLMMAIAAHETARGTSNGVMEKNNVGGLMQGNKLMTFTTLEKGIEAFAKTLHNRIIKDGNKTILELQKVYAPVGATNDPNNLNQYWIDGVTSFVMEFGGVKKCDLLGGLGNTDAIFINGSDKYVIPTANGLNISGLYGMRYHPIDKIWKMHNGIDLSCASGEPILAFTDGIVNYKEDRNGGWTTGLGNYVILNHGNGVTSWYGHMKSNTVKVIQGQTVKAGEQIGGCGTTGKSTGNHLHLEIRLNNSSIDPKPYLMGAETL